VATPLALALSLQLGWKAEARAISEARYSDGMAEKVAPFVRAQMHAGVFAGQRQVAIHYRSFACPGAGATVVVLTGYSESARKYDELAYDLCQAGFASVAMDHRGQGESGRLNKSPPMAAIDNFDFLVDDLESLLERAVPADRPRYLVAHSMGATVAALYLQRHPGAFRGAALSAPMLAINLEGRGEFLTKAKLLALAAWGGFDSYLPGRGPDVPGHQAFARNAVT
jgi:lysophospholipase